MVTIIESNQFLHRMVFKWILNHRDLDDLTLDQFLSKHKIDHNNRGQLMVPEDLLTLITLESNNSDHSNLVDIGIDNYTVIITDKKFCSAINKMLFRICATSSPGHILMKDFYKVRANYDIVVDYSKYGPIHVVIPVRLYDLIYWANMTNIDDH